MPFPTYYTEAVHGGMWPVVEWWPCIAEGDLRCSLYLSSSVLADSIYSYLQYSLLHLNLYITPCFSCMGSLSLGGTSMFLIMHGCFSFYLYTCSWLVDGVWVLVYPVILWTQYIWLLCFMADINVICSLACSMPW